MKIITKIIYGAIKVYIIFLKGAYNINPKYY